MRLVSLATALICDGTLEATEGKTKIARAPFGVA